MIKVSLGTFVAQTIGFVAAPVLSRLYSPEAFGLLALFFAVSGMVKCIATWRYETTIPLPLIDEDAVAIVHLCLWITAGMTLLIGIGVILWGRELAVILHESQLWPWARLIPLDVLLHAITMISNYWAFRKSLFRTVALSRIIQTATSVTAQILVGITLIGKQGGLIVGYLIGLACQAGYLTIMNLKITNKFASKLVAYKQVKRVAKTHRDVAIYGIPGAFVNTLSGSLTPILFTATFGVTVAGVVSFSERLLAKPIELITESIWQVTHSKIAHFEERGKRHHILSIHRFVTYLLAFPVLAVVLFGRFASTLFGDAWAGLNLALPMIACMVFFQGVSNATSYFVAFRLVKTQVRFDLMLLVLKPLCILAGARWLGPFQTIGLYAAMALMVYVAINVYWGCKLKIFRSFLMNYLVHLSFAGILLGAVAVSCHSIVMIGLGLLLSALTYYLLGITRGLYIWKHTSLE
jgi:lipopolysaccharide exporter